MSVSPEDIEDYPDVPLKMKGPLDVAFAAQRAAAVNSAERDSVEADRKSVV